LRKSSLDFGVGEIIGGHASYNADNVG
jgi:hypothetical protein